MTEFERWDKKEYPLLPTIERGPISREFLKQRKHTWKAALEWILKIKKQGHQLAYYDADILMAIENEIEKELGETE